MPKLKISEPHVLGNAEARERIKRLLSDMKNRYSDKISDIQEEWDGDSANFSFKLMGFSVKGKLLVAETDVQLEGSLPFAAVPFKGMVETAIREQTKELLKK